MPYYFLFISLLLSFIRSTISLPSIGVTYSSYPSTTAKTTSSPPPDKISATITDLKIPNVRLPDAQPSLIKAFAFTNTSLFLSIPNPLLPAIAANRSLALRWLYRNVLPFYPRSKITLISVGNAVLDYVDKDDFTPFLLPAIRNLHLALHELGIRKIPVSTTFSFFSTITTAFPPSSGEFQQPAGDLIIKPLLQFLEETNSSFLINLYPYNLYRLNGEIPVGFALFQDYPFNFRDDLVTGVRYFNLFDMMADSVLTAMAAMGYETIPVVVAETGWPSGGGDVGEVEANEVYAEMYLKGLVKHLKSGIGTPLKKYGVAEVYVYELMDHHEEDDEKNGRKWGILSENFTRKYSLDISCGRGKKNSLFWGTLLILICILQFVFVNFDLSHLML